MQSHDSSSKGVKPKTGDGQNTDWLLSKLVHLHFFSKTSWRNTHKKTHQSVVPNFHLQKACLSTAKVRLLYTCRHCNSKQQQEAFNISSTESQSSTPADPKLFHSIHDDPSSMNAPYACPTKNPVRGARRRSKLGVPSAVVSKAAVGFAPATFAHRRSRKYGTIRA